jgi:hypothetical protein
MSNQPHMPVKARDEASCIIGGSFTCNNASDPDTTLIEGTGIVSITHTGTAGEFEITFDGTYPKIITEVFNKSADDSPSGDAVDFVKTSDTLSTDGKIKVQYMEAGAGINRLAADNVRLNVTLWVQNRVR